MPLRLLGRAARRKELFENDAKVASITKEATSVAKDLNAAVQNLTTWLDRKAHHHG